jgi:hypothetical protein
MANSTVIRRKDMKEPDKFQAAAGQAAGWLQEHARQVRAAVIAAAVVVVLAIAIAVWRQARADKAADALSEVTRALSGEISSVPLPGVPGPFYPDEAARQRAVADAAEKVRREFGGTDAARTATLALGDARLKLREWDAALAAYRDYASGSGGRDSMRFGALEGIALAEEGKGNLDGAAQAYDRLGKEVAFYADRADLERARVLAAAGKTEEARKLLASFSETHKDSALTGEAAERLARLGGK